MGAVDLSARTFPPGCTLKQVTLQAPCPAVDVAQAGGRTTLCAVGLCLPLEPGDEEARLRGLLDSGVGALPARDFSPCRAATDPCGPGLLCRSPGCHTAGVLPTGFSK